MSDQEKTERAPKWGAGHAAAMGPFGLAELRAALVDPSSNIVQPSEAGLYGTALPSEVREQRAADSQVRASTEPSVLGERLAEVERLAESSRDGRERESRDLGKE